MSNAILVNLNRCTGCWTCSMACKVAHNLEVDEFWQYIRTIGGGQIDEPGGEWPNLYEKWQPVFTEKCLLCSDRAAIGEEPYCVFNCPTVALTFGDIDNPDSAISKRMEELKTKGFEVYQTKPWEQERKGIYYIERC